MNSISRRTFLDCSLRSGIALSASIAGTGIAFGQNPRVSVSGSSEVETPARDSYDVVVYGATACGVLAAIAAQNEGMRVALVEPGHHVGGMVSGGLGRTDKLHYERVVGGLARQFFQRVGKHYGKSIIWTFEPSVAERAFRDWLKEAGVAIFFGQALMSIDKQHNSIVKLKTEQATFSGAVFLDCSYEGDLMKAAGVRYVVGREGRDKYDESLAGRREILPGHHQAVVAVPARGKDGKLPPYVVPQTEIAPLGAGDSKFQAYCFRLCLTDDPENRLPLPRPENYDRERYALVRNYLKAGQDQLSLANFLCLGRLPNHKCDANSCGFVSTDLLGAAWEYPEASRERRKEIWDEHLTWAQGFVYFLANDKAVPDEIKDAMSQWGLPKDEFLDTDHWPHQLYVREGRRMLGEYVMTQHDLQMHRRKYDSIGVGSYNIDIREVQWVACEVTRFPEVREEVLQEGYLSYPVEPYEIPYRSLLPRQEECDNLLVPVCASMSTIAYGSYRMEPQYMIAGQSAGVAAALAIKAKSPIHKLAIEPLQSRLREQGQVIAVDAVGK
jgi:hypothetical protein